MHVHFDKKIYLSKIILSTDSGRDSSITQFYVIPDQTG